MIFKKILVIFLICRSLSAEIRTIQSLNEALTEFDLLDNQALVIFDVDETLIVAQDKIRRKILNHDLNEFIKKSFDDLLVNDDHKERLESIRKLMTMRSLLEQSSPDIIKNLQARGIRVIALSDLHVGKYGVIDNLEAWRFKQLSDLGIDLSIHNATDIVFKNLPLTRNHYPVMYKGIFLTAYSCSKGVAIKALIDELGLKPSRVLFLDDRMNHVKSVDMEMAKWEIPCIAYHYRAFELLDNSVDIEIARLQYQYLMTHEIWLSDVDAKKRLGMVSF